MDYSSVQHISKAMVAEAPSPMYRWHRFWTRKPQNVVAAYIEHYSAEGDLVLDPFSGSGVAPLEAVRLGRSAISIDINPMATFIQEMTVIPIDIEQLHAAFSTISHKVESPIRNLYKTTCRLCNEEIDPVCFIWLEGKPIEVRYKCPYCGDVRAEVGCGLNESDRALTAAIESQDIDFWYPRNPLYYPDGNPFKEKQRYESIDTLFTKRNLLALSMLMAAIEDLNDRTVRDFMKIGFSSMVHNCSRMMPVRETRPFSAGWVQHTYWYAEKHMESNVWEKFENAIRGRQSLIQGKIESNQVLDGIRLGNTLTDLEGAAELLILQESAIDALRSFPPDSVDYVFTDPPYNAAIQFGELTYMWACWLRMDDLYDHVFTEEVIRNEQQHKDFECYYSMLHATFKEIFTVMKPGAYMTMTFHSPTTKVRNATIRASMFAGFDYEKSVYQPPNRPSLKSLYQPFGSAQGDFYLRFRKPPKGQQVQLKEIDEARYENIVVETVKRVLAERGEPTPYTHIVNYVDPVLAKHGFFLEFKPEKDVAAVLRDHIGKEFKLVEQRIGKAKGQAWWLQDMSIVYRLGSIPLVERVEATVLRELWGKYKVSFSDVLNAVYTEFPNALTPDSHNVLDILKEYAGKGRGGMWVLKKTENEQTSEHSEMIYHLAEIGRSLGFDIAIGAKEQSQMYLGIKLRDLATSEPARLPDLSPRQLGVLRGIDVSWYQQDKQIVAIFEVEHTTMLTEAIVRGSHLPLSVKRYLVLPIDRNRMFHRKLSSPLFSESFQEQGWDVLYYPDVRSLSAKKKFSLEGVAAIAGVKPLGSRTSKQKKADRTVLQRRMEL